MCPVVRSGGCRCTCVCCCPPTKLCLCKCLFGKEGCVCGRVWRGQSLGSVRGEAGRNTTTTTCRQQSPLALYVAVHCTCLVSCQPLEGADTSPPLRPPPPSHRSLEAQFCVSEPPPLAPHTPLLTPCRHLPRTPGTRRLRRLTTTRAWRCCAPSGSRGAHCWTWGATRVRGGGGGARGGGGEGIEGGREKHVVGGR